MTLRKCILTNNNCYKAQVKMKKIKGIMVHSTGANNPNLKRYVQPDDGHLGTNNNGNDWNRPAPDGRSVCVHAFIGKCADGSIATYQTLPFDIRGWHCGGSGNNEYIGFEICEDALSDHEYFKAVYKEAVEFCVYLCKEYSLKATDIICHAEGYQQGIATNHSDVIHWFSRFGVSMDDFRSDVAKKMNVNMKEQKLAADELPQIPTWAEATIKKLIEKKYLVGDEKGNIVLSYDAIQVLVILDRTGVFDK